MKKDELTGSMMDHQIHLSKEQKRPSGRFSYILRKEENQ